MPYTSEWVYLNEPDMVMPSGATLADPDAGELRAIDKARIDDLTDEERGSEKAAHIQTSQREYSLDTIAADLAGSPEAIDQAKADALAQYDARLEDIKALYS